MTYRQLNTSERQEAKAKYFTIGSGSGVAPNMCSSPCPSHTIIRLYQIDLIPEHMSMPCICLVYQHRRSFMLGKFVAAKTNSEATDEITALFIIWYKTKFGFVPDCLSWVNWVYIASMKIPPFTSHKIYTWSLKSESFLCQICQQSWQWHHHDHDDPVLPLKSTKEA